ncbi:MAG: LamG-like jellyroll fold domain-containing protein [Verrucomicrobiota bacterium]
MRALNHLLRTDADARDEYLIRIELHNRLASEADLFSEDADFSLKPPAELGRAVPPMSGRISEMGRRHASPNHGSFVSRVWAMDRTWILALAACFILLAGIFSLLWLKRSDLRSGTTSKTVAMLARTVDARWVKQPSLPRAGVALEPGWLHLEAGLAQIVFYSGARVVIEGPTDLQLISSSEAVCPSGRLLAEVPEPARGFRIRTGQLNVVDLGTAFGLDTDRGQTEVDVFKGEVELSAKAVAVQALREGTAVLVVGAGAAQFMAARQEAFTNMLEFQQRSLAAEALRYDQWRLKSTQLNQDPSLVVHFDFEGLSLTDSSLKNAADKSALVQEATMVGCEPAQGRWREKPALEFQSVNDRIRLAVPGEFQSLTLSAWVCLKGLDRQFNSLVMSDGFDPGTIHWLIRNDGVLGLTVFGAGSTEYQILASPPVIGVDDLGTWLHLAVVLDGKANEAVQYLNGVPVSRRTLKIRPPFRFNSTELGNWNPRRDPGSEPSLIRNLSGSMDDFELFSRALSQAEIWELYTSGKPEL